MREERRMSGKENRARECESRWNNVIKKQVVLREGRKDNAKRKLERRKDEEKRSKGDE